MFALPAGDFPNYIVGGPDGNVWFTLTGFTPQAGGVGYVTPAGAITEFPLTTAFHSPYQITLGPDGNLWFTEIFGGKIGRLTPSGTLTEFIVGGQPTGITVGPDGRLWFADMGLGRLRSISTTGVLGAEFGGFSNPREVVTGADGNLWVSEYNAHTITRVTPLGSITRFRLPSGSFSPQAVTAGPDGNVWYTTPEKVGRITPSGTMTEFSPPTPGSWVFDITTGPDGNLWFTQRNVGSIGRVTPDGVITEFPTPAQPDNLSGIASGPDGNVWFVDSAGAIGRIELAADTTPPTISVPDGVIVDATSPAGAAVTYSVTATDDVDTHPSVACTPASGNVFPIGRTTVECTASDSAGNEAIASFEVHVKGASEQLDDLLALVNDMRPGSSLADKINTARSALAAANEGLACETLAAFVNEAKAQSGKKLTPEQSTLLVTAASRIRAVLAC